MLRYNRFPDEKGTEREAGQSRVGRQRSYNRFPDEKGTERNIRCWYPYKFKVTIVSPMKRGLKG